MGVVYDSLNRLRYALWRQFFYVLIWPPILAIFDIKKHGGCRKKTIQNNYDFSDIYRLPIDKYHRYENWGPDRIKHDASYTLQTRITRYKYWH